MLNADVALGFAAAGSLNNAIDRNGNMHRPVHGRTVSVRRCRRLRRRHPKLGEVLSGSISMRAKLAYVHFVGLRVILPWYVPEYASTEKPGPIPTSNTSRSGTPRTCLGSSNTKPIQRDALWQWPVLGPCGDGPSYHRGLRCIRCRGPHHCNGEHKRSKALADRVRRSSAKSFRVRSPCERSSPTSTSLDFGERRRRGRDSNPRCP